MEISVDPTIFPKKHDLVNLLVLFNFVFSLPDLKRNRQYWMLAFFVCLGGLGQWHDKY